MPKWKEKSRATQRLKNLFSEKNLERGNEQNNEETSPQSVSSLKGGSETQIGCGEVGKYYSNTRKQMEPGKRRMV